MRIRSATGYARVIRSERAVELRADQLRLDQERPGQDRGRRRQDGCIERTATVAAADAAADHHQEPERDERVAGEVQHVGHGRERVLADDLVPVPEQVAGHEQGLADGHQDPRRGTVGLVAPDTDEGDGDRRRADHVVEQALREAAGLERRVDHDQQRADGEIGHRQGHTQVAGSSHRHHMAAAVLKAWLPHDRLRRVTPTAHGPGVPVRGDQWSCAVCGRTSPETTKPPVARRLSIVMSRPGRRSRHGWVGQCAQPLGAPPSSAVRKLEPQPQAATAFGLLTVKPAPMSVST